jgi:hypothetical protein
MKNLIFVLFVITSLYSSWASAKGRAPLSLCSPTSEAVEFAVASIRNFLMERPAASDTLDGVHSWWINWAEPAPTKSCTLVALKRLESEGVVEEVFLEASSVWRRARN